MSNATAATHLIFPAELTFRERVELRVARLLIQGHVVAYPGAKELSFALTNEADSPGLRDDLVTPRLVVDEKC